MRILVMVGSLGLGGTSKAAAAYASLLSVKHSVLVWGCKTGGEIAEMLATNGVNVVVGPECETELRAFKPDVVNFHQPGTFTEDEVVSMLKKVRSQWSNARIIETNVFGRPDPRFLGLADVSVQVSLWDLWQWNRWRGKHYPIAGIYCPNPVDCEAYKRATDEEIGRKRAEWNVPSGAKVIGRIGNTNWETLEGPLLKCLEMYPDLYLVNVNDHNYRGPDTIVRHPRVRVIDKMRTDAALCQFYSACDVMVSMSAIGESFGYVNAEAMACETPVIALSTPLHCNAQADVVGGGGCPTIASPKMLPVAVARYFDSCDHRAMGAQARESIRERYSFETCAKILDGIFVCKDEQMSGMTQVEDAVIRKILSQAMGRYSLLELVAFPIYYSRFGYLALRTLKRKMGGLYRVVRKALMQ